MREFLTPDQVVPTKRNRLVVGDSERASLVLLPPTAPLVPASRCA